MCEQDKTVLLERPVNARHPAHLADAPRERLVIGAEEVDPVASGLLGSIASGVGSTERLRQRLPWVGQNRDPDAGAQAEDLVPPAEAALAHGLQHLLRDAGCHFLGAMFEQQTKLVTAQAAERVVMAHVGTQQIRDLAQQLVARRVSAGIVDHLELVQVDVAQRVLGRVDAGTLERLFDAQFELAPVDQTGERVVRGVEAQLAGDVSLSRYVVEHEHRADQIALTTANGSGRVGDRILPTVARQQERLLAQPVGSTLQEQAVYRVG